MSVEQNDAELDRITAEYEVWLDDVMRYVLPRKLYEARRLGKAAKKTNRWLEKNGYFIRTLEDKIQVCVRKSVLAEFTIVTKT